MHDYYSARAHSHRKMTVAFLLEDNLAGDTVVGLPVLYLGPHDITPLSSSAEGCFPKARGSRPFSLTWLAHSAGWPEDTVFHLSPSQPLLLGCGPCAVQCASAEHCWKCLSVGYSISDFVVTQCVHLRFRFKSSFQKVVFYYVLIFFRFFWF